MKFTRRSFLSTGALATAAGVLPAQQHQAASPGPPVPRDDQRPNIIFVITDDLRYDGLSSTGHPFAQTPHIDRIAHEGVKFNNFFCTTPLCSPSRASFLTGLYAHTHQIVNNDNHGEAELSHRLPTFPRILFNADYETAFIGKWHMGFDDTMRPGFDHWIGFRAQGLYENCVFNLNGERRQLRGYSTDFLNDYAVQFLERPHPKPFVLYLGHKAPHYPYLPATRYNDLYKGDVFKAPAVAPNDVERKPALHKKYPPVDRLHAIGATPEPQESRRGRSSEPADIVRDQARCMASVDDGMGMIFDTLERTRQLDNTILIFTSDNGYLMGEHGLIDNKRWAYEPSIRLPLLMRYPKLIKAGSERNQSVLNIDIAPTLLDLAGVTPYGKMQGKSLLPVFRDADAPLRDSFLCEYFQERYDPTVQDWQCVRGQRWKYTHYPTLDGMDELYDLAADPGEEANLFGDTSLEDVRHQMSAELTRLLAETQQTMHME
jgi:N-acetylglucosamine-6-sulfatase